ncbi:beta-glucosidase [Paremcibacter congregatus]|uniref:Beta-glucosidase n=2 Tax=Paremcibacter congregatus TaxID=2043170 RepID=A0A2G4YWH8_9PROT|nr:beta-glucosidase [Paremcibacter congregatus]QDE29132.1 beta-glucosidase [Paremcibacter congregatus]
MIGVAHATEAPDFSGQAYDQHVELFWAEKSDPQASYVIKVSVNEGDWVTRCRTNKTGLLDFVGEFGNDLKLSYRLYSQTKSQENLLGEVSLKTRTFTDDELVEMVQKYTFRYFWQGADEKSGWAFERQPNTGEAVITTGGTGFAILSIITAAERGWISREAAVMRLLKITTSLKRLETFHGMWAHWYRAGTEEVFHFSKYDNGGDIVESAFMAQGLLAARQYFNQSSTDETRLRTDITGLWEKMDWQWYTQGQDILYWHWSKTHGWKMNHKITGYNEALIAYVLAASSPTHAISKAAYHKGWAGQNNGYFKNGKTFYGLKLPLGNQQEMGGPLFFAHYSFLGLDPRGLSDRYANYWTQNQHQTLISHAYSMDNPKNWKGYGPDFWGLTAGDMVPDGYTAHAPGERDFGTINPTGALSSMPYAPTQSLALLKNLYYRHGKELFGPMGFYDAINLSVSDDPRKQVKKTYLAIDQGPIIIMLENYRSGLLWDSFMKDPDVRKGLDKLGFTINNQKNQ